jgi:hypothetical protein
VGRRFIGTNPLNTAINSLGSYIKTNPRTAAALAFGCVTLLAQHFVWFSNARTSGLPLTIAAGFAHGVAGVITGRRLLDSARTTTPLQAGLLGAGTSLLALIMFAPTFAVFLFATGVHPVGPLSYIAIPLLIAAFAFLADSWVLLVVSVVVGWALYRACCQ